jgi:acetylcholinesterase
MADHLIRFTSNLNPNHGVGYQWPKYTLSARKMATYVDGLTPLVTTEDTYRSEAMDYLNTLTLANPI